jgi:sugar (pentulose or hexulose) kinase
VVRECFIGLDLGTSGCRALAIDAQQRILAEARAGLPAPERDANGGVEQDAERWWAAVVEVLRALARKLLDHRPVALCLDGTSSTLLLCAADGAPLAPALMYSDTRSRAQAERIAAVAPSASPARGASSSLAKLLFLADRLKPAAGTLALHQCDWVLGRLTGRFGISDWNNALKLGYDPQNEDWPEWIERLDLGGVRLPRVLAPATVVAPLSPEAATATGLPPQTLVATGTTDSTAAVVATGIREPGEAVTCLGSTLVLKVLATAPVTAPEYGVYSHRLGNLWLVGGASNSGGAVLRQFFDDAQMRRLTAALAPDRLTGLDYYPLPAPGERFPVNNSLLPPRLTPRPTEDVRFFQGMLEGIARIEAAGYRRLRALGAPAPIHVMSIGGGASNPGWTRIRARLLGVPVTPAAQQEAAFGAALLALKAGA